MTWWDEGEELVTSTVLKALLVRRKDFGEEEEKRHE